MAGRRREGRSEGEKKWVNGRDREGEEYGGKETEVVVSAEGKGKGCWKDEGEG